MNNKDKNDSLGKKKKQAEIKISETLLIERERLALVGQLMSGIAHNLNTPLMGAAGQLMLNEKKVDAIKKILEKHGIPENEYKQHIDDITRHQDMIRKYLYYMSDVVNNIKTYVKDEPEELSNYFSIQDLFDKVSLLTSFEVKRNKVEIIYKILEQLDHYTIKGNINNLVQIMVNLIENAIHSYDENPGNIQIKAYKEVVNNVNYIKISVTDNGSGINEKVRPKLFKQMVTTKGKKGSGIGLYISNIILKANFNGFIDYETTVGKGTTMYVCFPLVED